MKSKEIRIDDKLTVTQLRNRLLSKKYKKVIDGGESTIGNYYGYSSSLVGVFTSIVYSKPESIKICFI